MLAMVLSMIHVMVCNAGMTIVCGVCGRTIEYGIVAAACDRAPGFGMRVPFRAPGCADRPTDRARGRRRWTDRQTAPGRAGQTAPGGGATGGEIRLRRRGDRDPGGASASSRARGNFGSGAARPLLTVDLRASGEGRGGDFGGRACGSEPGGTRREEIRRHFGSKPAGISVAAPGRAAETRACARSRKAGV